MTLLRTYLIGTALNGSLYGCVNGVGTEHANFNEIVLKCVLVLQNYRRALMLLCIWLITLNVLNYLKNNVKFMTHFDFN